MILDGLFPASNREDAKDAGECKQVCGWLGNYGGIHASVIAIAVEGLHRVYTDDRAGNVKLHGLASRTAGRDRAERAVENREDERIRGDSSIGIP